jgi:hypothetical protein
MALIPTNYTGYFWVLLCGNSFELFTFSKTEIELFAGLL